jgi:hypothetical protein
MVSRWRFLWRSIVKNAANSRRKSPPTLANLVNVSTPFRWLLGQPRLLERYACRSKSAAWALSYYSLQSARKSGRNSGCGTEDFSKKCGSSAEWSTSRITADFADGADTSGMKLRGSQLRIRDICAIRGLSSR